MATNDNLKQGLRDLLAFIEANDDINFEIASNPPVEMHFRSWYLHALNKDGKRDATLDVVRRLGAGDKDYYDAFFNFTHKFNSAVHFVVHAERETICERVKVGEEVVPQYVLPARTETVVPEHVVEKFEWRCDSLLAPEPALTSAE